MTNTAIDLVRQVEQAFETTLQRPARFPTNLFPVWTLPALRYCANYAPFATATSSEIGDFVNTSSGSTLGFSMAGCDFTFYPVFTSLTSFPYHIKRGEMYPEISLRKLGTGPLLEGLGQTIELALTYRLSFMTYVSDQWTYDEVTRGMEYVIRSKTIPIWVTFGVQVLLDIGKFLGNSMSRPFSELCECAPYYTSRDQPLQRPFTNGASETAGNEEMLETLEMLRDSIYRACQRDSWYKTLSSEPRVMENSILARVVTEEFFFYKRQPIICGLMKYRVYAEVTVDQIDRENKERDMFALAYIYKAARILDSSTPTWLDMEFALYRQDPKRIFCGKPETLGTIEKTFFLVGGSSAVNSARNGRGNKPNLNNIRNFERPNSFLITTLYQRLNQTGLPRDSNINESTDTVVRSIIQGMNNERNQKQFIRQMNMPKNFNLSNLQQLQSLSNDPRPVEVLSALIN
ncbi:hypothetical protein Ptr902_10433 [Pyrenophora tritici-repentis]|nr:hypothetical protein Ptr902_10433 [Pyrenophora tritici-repentis]